MSFQIAIDGPAGAGKSTIAKLVAERLSFIYVDTGAMYRAIAIGLLKAKADIDRDSELQKCCDEMDITIEYHDGEQVVILDGENVNPLLRTEEVTEIASKSSANPIVRRRLLALQRELSTKYNVVMDGRDIGTVILPNAQVKIFLTARAEVRAKRRYLEFLEKGIPCDLEEIRRDMEDRDYRDIHREISPLKKADDAVLVDASELTIEEVVEKVLSICREKGL